MEAASFFARRQREKDIADSRTEFYVSGRNFCSSKDNFGAYKKMLFLFPQT